MFDLSTIYKLRREYISKQLRRSDLSKNPMHLFNKWLHESYLTTHISDPNAMCLSTVDHKGQPFQRLVLLKYFNNKTMTFFTNLNSRKSVHLKNNPKVSLCFPWNVINRQIIITGHAYELPKKKSLEYFYTRPKNNQISTWVSKQSTIIPSKTVLKNKFLKLKKKYFQKSVPFPNFWGGYIINIDTMEFWQGGIHRLHDRFLYIKNKKKWYIKRLSP